jgi:hypothetical protein
MAALFHGFVAELLGQIEDDPNRPPRFANCWKPRTLRFEPWFERSTQVAI